MKWTVRIAVGLSGLMLLIVAPAAVLLGGSGGCGSLTPAPATLNPEAVMTYLEQNVPMTAIAAAGAEGNLQWESGGLNPAAPGGGLAQWLGDRWTALVSWDQQRSLDPSSGQGQLAYLVHDLQTSYAGLAREMDVASSVGEAALEFMNEYEVCDPAKCNPSERVVYANAALAGSASVPVSLSLGPSTACAATGPGGYVNPLARATGITWERTDQGVDASMTPGSPILALGLCQVKMIVPFFLGESVVVCELLNGALAGDWWYMAEQVTPIVSDGETVQAGGEIGTYAPTGTGIETGWWTPNGGYPLGHDGYQEGIATLAGADFRFLLNQLGANAGTGAGLSSGVTLGAQDYP